jgi:hypothetical protein
MERSLIMSKAHLAAIEMYLAINAACAKVWRATKIASTVTLVIGAVVALFAYDASLAAFLLFVAIINYIMRDYERVEYENQLREHR